MRLSSKLVGLMMMAMLTAAPASAAATGFTASTELTDAPSVRISLANQDLRIQNADHSTLRIFSVTGACVAVYNIDSSDKTITLTLPRGCYIINVGKVTRKVFLH